MLKTCKKDNWRTTKNTTAEETLKHLHTILILLNSSAGKNTFVQSNSLFDGYVKYLLGFVTTLSLRLLKEVFDKEQIFRGQTRGKGKSRLNLMFTDYRLFYF